MNRSVVFLLAVAGLAFGEVDENYTVQRGDSLDAIATRRYGHRSYGKLIELHNSVQAERLAAGTQLKLPELSELLRAEKLGAVLPEESGWILEARTSYQSIEKRLWQIRRDAPGGPVPEEVSGKLLHAANALDLAAAGLSQFSALRPETVQPPRSMIVQLSQASETLRGLAAGKFDEYGYDLDMVHQRLGLSLSYGLVWARNGFR